MVSESPGAYVPWIGLEVYRPDVLQGLFRTLSGLTYQERLHELIGQHLREIQYTCRTLYSVDWLCEGSILPPGIAIMDNNGEMSPAALLAQMVGVIISVLSSLLAYTSDAQLEQLMYAFQSELSHRRVGHVGAASSPGATTVSPVIGHYPPCSNPSPGYSGATSSESAGPGHESDVHVVGPLFRSICAIRQAYAAAQYGNHLRISGVGSESRVYDRASAQLANWSGPFRSEEATQQSTWVSPVEEWEYELSVRQTVLQRCLLSPTVSKDRMSSDVLEDGFVPLLQLPDPGDEPDSPRFPTPWLPVIGVHDESP
ncbi:hypothetical protein AK812_SmicGene165 [Symbiodinium microadriaticum]|uniref:Uncharacterized protein n=1 Tax=Symbiodinium microadriaticum TaxID=2951 RepID=A0A1Q9F775_SYMMI|nr:hypothetical protein AK812_SmicGene165 [Symbiodinium microadriaticum]